MKHRHCFAQLLAASLTTLTLATTALAGPVPGQGTWQTTLQARDLNGDTVTDAFYDTVLNITWLRDARANRDNGRFGVMTWQEATAWASNFAFGGYSDWRLPTMIDTGVPGCVPGPGIPGFFAGGADCGYNSQTVGVVSGNQVVYSEMAHLYYSTLGNWAACPPGNSGCSGQPVPGAGLVNTGDFIDLNPWYYWTGLAYAGNNFESWSFLFQRGIQINAPHVGEFLAMAVRDGDVLPPDSGNEIPEPGTLALLGLALAGLAVCRQKAVRVSAQ